MLGTINLRTKWKLPLYKKHYTFTSTTFRIINRYIVYPVAAARTGSKINFFEKFDQKVRKTFMIAHYFCVECN